MILKVGTDYTGLGSPEQGLKDAKIDFKSVFACDNDKYVKASFLANNETGIFYEDVTMRDNSAAPYVDWYVFGFPCQAFSSAGNRLGFEDARGTLYWYSLDYINIKRPRFFTAENVKGLLSHDKKKGSKAKFGNTFNTIINSLALTVNGQINMFKYEDCLNYHIRYQILNAKDYGLPQNRERIFIMGFRDESDARSFNFPKKEKLKLRIDDIVEEPVDEKYFLSKKMLAGLRQHNQNSKDKKRGFKFDPMPIDTDRVAKCIRANYYKMGPDDTYLVCRQVGRNPDNPGQRKTGAYLEQMLELNKNPKIANTITSVQKDNLLFHFDETAPEEEQERIRRLTPRECFRLQGFPDSFFDRCQLHNSDTQLYKQAGNSMATTVLKALAEQLPIN